MRSSAISLSLSFCVFHFFLARLIAHLNMTIQLPLLLLPWLSQPQLSQFTTTAYSAWNGKAVRKRKKKYLYKYDSKLAIFLKICIFKFIVGISKVEKD